MTDETSYGNNWHDTLRQENARLLTQNEVLAEEIRRLRESLAPLEKTLAAKCADYGTVQSHLREFISQNTALLHEISALRAGSSTVSAATTNMTRVGQLERDNAQLTCDLHAQTFLCKAYRDLILKLTVGHD